MLADGAASMRACQGHPLAGSPAGRLHDATARILAAGTLPRCPHPDPPPLWYLPAGSHTCGPRCEACHRTGLEPLAPN